MPDHPYSDADLRTEAARQHSLILEDADFMGIGERMDGTEISSPTTEDERGVILGTTWDELPREDFDAAQRSIDDLLKSAADVSEWAINLGDDGLVPSNGHQLTLDGDSKPFARLHFAFEPDMDERMKNTLVTGIAQALAQAL